jgi:hypothetical protein
MRKNEFIIVFTSSKRERSIGGASVASYGTKWYNHLLRGQKNIFLYRIILSPT